ncbi:MAG TPA: cytochrome c3 family protein [Kofleriaceae bacterium]
MSRRTLAGVALVVAVALAACAHVLGFTTSEPTAFPHRKHVLSGVACVSCHVGIEGPSSALHIPTDEMCITCHAKPHDTRSCNSCHASRETAAELVETKDHLRFDHAKHLAGPAKGNCMRCHSAVAEGDRHLRPAMATCFKCHDKERDARTCNTCHRDLAEENSLPQSHLAHDGDWIREHGTRAASSGDLCETCHSRQTFCASCHGVTVPVLAGPTRLTNPLSASPHVGNFGARHSLEARAEPGACTTCHQPERCASCHRDRGVAGDTRASPHPPGWVGLTSSENLHGRAARRDPATCASCHSGAGEKLCVQCHAVGGVGGNPHPPGWSSRLPRSALPCRMCHPSGAR